MASEVYGGTAAILDRGGQQVGWARFGKSGRYLGSVGMRRGDEGALQNAIRTVGARQAARTQNAYRNRISAARESGVPTLSGGGSARIVRPRAGRTSESTVNGINYSISHERSEGGTGHIRVSDTGASGHYMDFWYGRGHINSQSSAWKKAKEWMQSPRRAREHKQQSK